ncbi:hypothetical protein ISS37_06645 [candidate division KSB1 bacterium]|nr:hypothetical protein [candidate division KSB1 bacterium]
MATFAIKIRPRVGGNGEGVNVYRNHRVVYKGECLEHSFPMLEWIVTEQILKNLDGYYQLHAGGVERNERTIIFPGGNGAGKTSLVLALLKRGYNVLSDEVVLIDPDSLLLFPYPRNFVVRASRSGDCIGNLDFSYSEPDEEYRPQKIFYLNPRAIKEYPFPAKGLKLNYVVFPQYDRTRETGLEPIGQAGIITGLIEHSFNFDQFRGGWFDILPNLARGCRGYKLSYRDADEAVGIIEELTG